MPLSVAGWPFLWNTRFSTPRDAPILFSGSTVVPRVCYFCVNLNLFLTFFIYFCCFSSFLYLYNFVLLDTVNKLYIYIPVSLRYTANIFAYLFFFISFVTPFFLLLYLVNLFIDI